MTTELVFHFQLVEIYAIEGPAILDTANVFFHLRSNLMRALGYHLKQCHSAIMQPKKFGCLYPRVSNIFVNFETSVTELFYLYIYIYIYIYICMYVYATKK